MPDPQTERERSVGTSNTHAGRCSKGMTRPGMKLLQVILQLKNHCVTLGIGHRLDQL